MEEEKTLLQIIKTENGMDCRWQGYGHEDLFNIALAISDFARRNEMFLLMLLGLIKMIVTDGKFAKELDESVIEMPDFNSILNNTKDD